MEVRLCVGENEHEDTYNVFFRGKFTRFQEKLPAISDPEKLIDVQVF